MKKQTLELVEKTVAKIKKKENSYTCWHDAYDDLADSCYEIMGWVSTDAEFMEEETAAAYEICKQVDNDLLWGAYRKFNDGLDPDTLETHERYNEWLDICKKHKGEVPFDDLYNELTSWYFKEYFGECE